LAIGAGPWSSHAVLADGTVRSWGDNSAGQLGDGTYVQRTRPVAVSGLSNVASVFGGGAHACALRNDGTAACWGYNTAGQLEAGDARA
jgi:alpha-tubulin suppressor-like RCC1 family protein